MSRTTVRIETGGNLDIDVINEEWRRIVGGAGYSEKIVKGEPCWSKGDGVLMKQQNFAIVYGESEIILQAWMGDAVTGESDLTGFVAKIPKKKMQGILNEAEAVIRNHARYAMQVASDSPVQNANLQKEDYSMSSTAIDTWHCACGRTASGNFCSNCGRARQ